MSKEIAKAFINRLETDKLFQQKVAGMGEVDLSNLISFARLEGYAFSEADWELAYQGIAANQQELNDAELETVAGGLNPQPLPPKYAVDLSRPYPLPKVGIIVIGGKTHF